MLKRIEPQISDDITNLVQEASVLKEKRNSRPGAVYYPAGMFLVLKIMKADNLAVVHGIVKSYGGDIKIYSESGKGTTFHVYFPCIEV